ncbi:hypothetical protein P5673_012814 [Acropora cervicornis]|uniref:Uncharacterized protein n=1 Tax=Acropora cervicornis TaxID=6130 RepID=A0AAD9V7P6_ACRCE|nr:hypothetical protein P5673_012814 [Acropora cervicornis]
MSTTEEILAQFEEMFSKRYTSEDVEYMKTVNRQQPSPPCLTDWGNVGYRDGRHDSRGDGRGFDRSRHDGGRDHGRRYGDHDDNRRGDDRYRHRDDRYGGRNRDERYRAYEDRQKPATEYGSQGFYELYY